MSADIQFVKEVVADSISPTFGFVNSTYNIVGTDLDYTTNVKFVDKFQNEIEFDVAAVSPEYELGDVNFDGALTVQDIVLVVPHILGTSEPPFTQEQLEIVDMNADNSVDIQDLVAIVNILLEI